MCKTARDSVAASVRWALVALLLLPLPVMASDFTGVLTLFIAMPLFLLTALVLGLLLVFRRHRWVRVMGTIVAVPILLAGIGVAWLDTWRAWPSLSDRDPVPPAMIVILYVLMWLGLLAQAWLLWRWPSRPRRTGTPTAVSQAPDSP
ncbi:hypothetical protein [Stenotrophomonas sp. TWI819]|uniref:hypothetical protein n=1 Tax=Stenotrophomonas sp. TWI819 TaxID=3136800 RepID=UPI0032097668